MKLAVWGGSGFIGTTLVTLLLKNPKNRVKIFDKKLSDTHKKICELADIVEFRGECYFDVLINLAAEHKDDVLPIDMYDRVNVEGAKNLCNLARKNNISHIIFTSSVAVYGFAEIGADESAKIAPYNDYGRTKWEAEQVYREWQAEDEQKRTLTIIRPTVVFGEKNRGNVFNLFKQIASGRFLMIGNGKNRKSMAYVENVAAFIEYSLTFKKGIHLYNYVDKPDFSMNKLIGYVSNLLGQGSKTRIRLPYIIGLLIGNLFDFAAKISGKKFSISAIRVKKFCSNSVYKSGIDNTGFLAPVELSKAIEKTVRFEFLEDHKDEPVSFSE